MSNNPDALLAYIEAHPDEPPEKVLAAFGVPFVPEIWNRILQGNLGKVEELKGSPNPADRAWTEPR